MNNDTARSVLRLMAVLTMTIGMIFGTISLWTVIHAYSNNGPLGRVRIVPIMVVPVATASWGLLLFLSSDRLARRVVA